MVEQTAVAKYTYDDYIKTPDDEHWELLNGELVMPPAPNIDHQRLVGSLFTRLNAFVSQSVLGEVFFAPCDVVLSEVNVVQPDLLFISTERSRIITRDNVRGAPDLVIEVLSPGSVSRDWRQKMDVYAEHGVREYWIVDPDARRAWVMTQSEGGFDEAGNYGVSDVLQSSVLEGLELDLAELFETLR